MMMTTVERILLLSAVLVIVFLAPASAEVLEQTGERGVARLEIETGEFAVNVTVGSGDVTEIKVLGSRRYRASLTRRGDLLTLKTTRRRGILYLLFSSRQDLSIDVIVPGFVELSVQSASGDVRLRGLHEGGLTVSTASGNILLDDGSGKGELVSMSGAIELGNWTGDLEVGTASGEFRAESVHGTLNLATASGTVDIGEVRGKAALATVSGDVEIREFRPEENAEILSVSGNIDLGVDPDDLRFELTSVSGTLHLFGNRAEHELSSGDGRTRVHIATTSGDVSVR